ncbi:MAG TPA: hypothetical protein VFG24_02585 [Nitrosopumilaceae archaeon]|nr:hypothetical protein [Nitrosopumilaceae archaeon]
MIPKGAIICIILGVIGSGLVGIFFSEIANQPPTLVYVLGPSLSVITEKTNFHLGEPISIKIVNSGTVPLTFSDTSYGLKIKQLDGIVLYSPISAQMISVLKPEEEKVLVWNQTKLDGSKIIEGRYNVVSSTDASSNNVLKKSITINIFK